MDPLDTFVDGSQKYSFVFVETAFGVYNHDLNEYDYSDYAAERAFVDLIGDIGINEKFMIAQIDTAHEVCTLKYGNDKSISVGYKTKSNVFFPLGADSQDTEPYAVARAFFVIALSDDEKFRRLIEKRRGRILSEIT